MTGDDRRYGNNIGVPIDDEKQFYGNIYYKKETGLWKCARCEKTADAFNVKGLIMHVRQHKKKCWNLRKNLI